MVPLSAEVKAALISELGALLYVAVWIVAMQYLYMNMRGTPEQAWVARAWAWWSERAERRWAITVRVYSRPAVEEPAPPGDVSSAS